jgi:nicotinamide phosphoribosyltransferase
MSDSILYLSDSYKVTHWRQYPPGSEYVYAYLESRGGMFDETTFFGLQYFLKKYLQGPVLTVQDIVEAEPFWDVHFGQPGLFNKDGWMRMCERHQGRLPVSIKAVPEGTTVPTRNVLMTVENTDPEFPWLTNFLESLLVQVWYPTTVATLSREMKKLILQHLIKTGGPEGVDFKLHDFGFRGVSSVDSAGIGGGSHLLNFMGTDTPQGIRFAMKYYGADVCGFSIPASEHSTITSWGRDHEVDAYDNMLMQYPEGNVACVSDSFNIYEACEKLWGEQLKEKILRRNGTLIVRPDSGDPPAVVGDILDILGKKFGYTENKQGYKVLPPQVRVIQGDGIDYMMTRAILTTMTLKGWSTENLAFGMGGALLQKMNRDTQKFAFKCSDIVVNGEHRAVMKDPITDSGKRSKAGRLKLLETVEGFHTGSQDDAGEDQLVEVFRDGEILREYSFTEVRERAALKY